MVEVMDQEDWLGEGLEAALNRELDKIEQRNGAGFMPTFKRDFAFNVAWLAIQAFSARGGTIGGAMLVQELQDKLGFSEATATLTTENAALAARVEALEGALRTIAKCESRFPGDVVDVARAALAGDPS